jgi:hypothetical protein
VDRFDRNRLYEHYPELKGFNLDPVANHFLEHCEDPLRTLANHLRVVRVGGVIYMAVLDKNYTFDKDREITTLDHLIRDYENGPLVSRTSTIGNR